MVSLFLDTHDANIIEVLYKDGVVLDKSVKKTERHHTEFVMPMLKELLEKNDLSVHDLGEIFICNGPGSFTGVRIGVTIAKTLGYTLNIPVKVISSLDCLAVSFSGNTKKLPIIRDVKGVFAALYYNNKLIDGPFYKSNDEFLKYKEKIEAEGVVVLSDIEYDFTAIYEDLKNVEAGNVHGVNPLYIKVIEALKND